MPEPMPPNCILLCPPSRSGWPLPKRLGIADPLFRLGQAVVLDMPAHRSFHRIEARHSLGKDFSRALFRRPDGIVLQYEPFRADSPTLEFRLMPSAPGEQNTADVFPCFDMR